MKIATRLLWLEYWASKVDPNYKYAVIQEEKGDDGYWHVEAKLPYYDKVIAHKSGKLIAAVALVAREACHVVDKLMEENPDLRVENKYVDGHWEVIMDEDGEGYTITQSEKYHKETQEIIKSLSNALNNQSNAILHLISRWIGSTKLAYFHIFDKRLFGNENKEIMKNMEILMKKLHKGQSSAVRTFISGDSVVSYGFTIETK